MTFNLLNIIKKMALKIKMQILVSRYAFKLVKNIISNFYEFAWQFMKSNMSWDMFVKILVFCF